MSDTRLTAAGLLEDATSLTRAELGERFNALGVPKEYYGHRITTWMPMKGLAGGIGIVAGVILSLMMLGLLAAITLGFKPAPNPNFYYEIIPALFSPGAAAIVVGIALTIWGCQQYKHKREEKLDRAGVERLLGEMRRDLQKGIEKNQATLNSPKQQQQELEQSIEKQTKDLSKWFDEPESTG